PPSAGMACRPRAWPAGDAPPARLRTGGAASGWTARATPTRGQAWERKAPLVRSSLVKPSAFFLHLRIPLLRVGSSVPQPLECAMAVKNIEELFVHELSDIYSAEKQLTRALPRLARAAGSEELSAAFEAHLEETHGQI